MISEDTVCHCITETHFNYIFLTNVWQCEHILTELQQIKFLSVYFEFYIHCAICIRLWISSLHYPYIIYILQMVKQCPFPEYHTWSYYIQEQRIIHCSLFIFQSYRTYVNANTKNYIPSCDKAMSPWLKTSSSSQNTSSVTLSALSDELKLNESDMLI